MKSGQEILALCDRVRQTAFELQCPLQVRDEDRTVLGDYFADLFVESDLILELKACKQTDA